MVGLWPWTGTFFHFYLIIHRSGIPQMHKHRCGSLLYGWSMSMNGYILSLLTHYLYIWNASDAQTSQWWHSLCAIVLTVKAGSKEPFMAVLPNCPGNRICSLWVIKFTENIFYLYVLCIYLWFCWRILFMVSDLSPIETRRSIGIKLMHKLN